MTEAEQRERRAKAAQAAEDRSKNFKQVGWLGLYQIFIKYLSCRVSNVGALEVSSAIDMCCCCIAVFLGGRGRCAQGKGKASGGGGATESRER
jgi:hypothetical protein